MNSQAVGLRVAGTVFGLVSVAQLVRFGVCVGHLHRLRFSFDAWRLAQRALALLSQLRPGAAAGALSTRGGSL